MNDYVIFRRNAWPDDAALERAAGRTARTAHTDLAGQIRWIRSDVFEEPDGTLGGICIYQATDRDALIEHARRSVVPCDDVRPLTRPVILEPDPTPTP